MHSTSPVDVVFDFPNSYPLLVLAISPLNVSKQKFTEYDAIRSCLRHMELHNYTIKETKIFRILIATSLLKDKIFPCAGIHFLGLYGNVP